MKFSRRRKRYDLKYEDIKDLDPHPREWEHPWFDRADDVSAYVVARLVITIDKLIGRFM